MPYITKEAVDDIIESLIERDCKLKDKEDVISFITYYFGEREKIQDEEVTHLPLLYGSFFYLDPPLHL